MVLLTFGDVAYSVTGTYGVLETVTLENGMDQTRPWRVVAYGDTSGEKYEPDLPVKICFFSSDTDTPHQCETENSFGIFIGLKIVKFCGKEDPCRGVLLITNSYAMGGGPYSYTLWGYDKILKKFKNLLSFSMQFGPQGTYKFFPSLHGKSILVTASPVRLIDSSADIDDPDRETIWSPHQYRLGIRSYSQEGGFISEGSFETKRKYDPEGDLDNVIDSEIERIKEFIK